MNVMQRINATSAGAAVVLIRILVGGVFLSEGVGKFLYPAEQGVGRFEKIPGIPAPHVMGPFVGGVEIVCGALILLGLLTRLAAIPLLIDISVAILSTKVPILSGHSYGLPKLAHYNLWGMLHEARVDFSMWLGLVFLLIVGAGRWSLDAWLFGSPARAREQITPPAVQDDVLGSRHAKTISPN
jgi:putative oxidoreductase